MDVGVGLFLFVFGILFYQRSKEKRSTQLTVIGGFLLSLSYWFRLEYLIFIGLYWFCEGIIHLSFSEKPKDKKKFFLASIVLILLFLVYCGFNQWFFNSPLGPRYNANYGSVGSPNLFKNFINLLFYGNLKLGLFGYSPFLFLGVLFFIFIFIKNWENVSEKENHF